MEFKSEKSGKSWSRVAIIVVSLITVGSLSFCIFRVIGLYKMGTLGELSRNWSTLVSAGMSITGTSLMFFLCICQKSKTINHEHDATTAANTPVRQPTQPLAEKEPSVRSHVIPLASTPTRLSRSTVKKEESFDWECYFSEDHFQEQNLNEMVYDAFLGPMTYLVKHLEDHEICVVLKTIDNKLLCSRKINEETFLKIKAQLLSYDEEKFEADDQFYELLSDNFDNLGIITAESFLTLPKNSFMKLKNSETEYCCLVLRTSRGFLLNTPPTNENQQNLWVQKLLSRGYSNPECLMLTVIEDKKTLESEKFQSIPKGFLVTISTKDSHYIVLRSQKNVLLRTPFTDYQIIYKWAYDLYSVGYHNGEFVVEYGYYDPRIAGDRQHYEALPQGEYVAKRVTRWGGLMRRDARNFFVVKTQKGALFHTPLIEDKKKDSFEQALALTYRKSTIKF